MSGTNSKPDYAFQPAHQEVCDLLVHIEVLPHDLPAPENDEVPITWADVGTVGEVMVIPAPKKGQWMPLRAIDVQAYRGPVYSMAVDWYRHYVADRIVRAWRSARCRQHGGQLVHQAIGNLRPRRDNEDHHHRAQGRHQKGGERDVLPEHVRQQQQFAVHQESWHRHDFER